MNTDPVRLDTNRYHARLSEAEREAEYRQTRANEIEREAVDYFGTEILERLSKAPNADELLSKFDKAKDTHRDVYWPEDKRYDLAEFGQAMLEAMTVEITKLVDEYVEREL